MKTMKLALALAGMLGTAGLAAQEPQGADARAFAETVRPVLDRYCVRCHGPRRQKGGLRLDELSRTFDDVQVAEQWRQIFYRLRFDEMPPPDRPKLCDSTT